jgi:hypothetical protein
VNRLLAGIAGALGLRWLMKKRREAVEHDAASMPRSAAAKVEWPEPAPQVDAPVDAEEASQLEAEPEADPRAEELRAKIEEAKAAGDDRDEFEAGETSVDEAGVDETDPEARRAAVHEQARARIHEMTGAQEGDSPVEDAPQRASDEPA